MHIFKIPHPFIGTPEVEIVCILLYFFVKFPLFSVGVSSFVPYGIVDICQIYLMGEIIFRN